jgi:hypothetical protein
MSDFRLQHLPGTNLPFNGEVRAIPCQTNAIKSDFSQSPTLAKHMAEHSLWTLFLF